MRTFWIKKRKETSSVTIWARPDPSKAWQLTTSSDRSKLQLLTLVVRLRPSEAGEAVLFTLMATTLFRGQPGVADNLTDASYEQRGRWLRLPHFVLSSRNGSRAVFCLLCEPCCSFSSRAACILFIHRTSRVGKELRGLLV